MKELRNRIKELRYVRASALRDNEKNWRRHPDFQRSALEAVLAEVGIADALIAYERGDDLVLIDGHLRRDLSDDVEWPVLVLDVDDTEADKLLATLDPLAGLAEADAEVLEALLATVETEDAALGAMLDNLAGKEWEVDYDEEWQGMPEFEQEDVFGAIATVKVHFVAEEDIVRFAELVEQTVTPQTKYLWYPKQERKNLKQYGCKDES